jgi:energy-coupling factor transporter transmembrane protein EcfT
MQLSEKNNWHQVDTLVVLKSFLIWCFTLTVCLLVIGFPLIVLMMTVGALLAVILHSVLPVSSVLLVAGSMISLNLLAVLIGAGLLTAKGIHPQEVSWLRWLHGEDKPAHTSVYASCPLTCELYRS